VVPHSDFRRPGRLDQRGEGCLSAGAIEVSGRSKRSLPDGNALVNLELLDVRRLLHGTMYFHHCTRRAPPRVALRDSTITWP
jgi:hypothetical protein